MTADRLMHTASRDDMANETSAREHMSCCAVHNEPAMPSGPCDCMAGLPDFRKFYADRNALPSGPNWAGTIGEPYDAVICRLAETMADYADEIRKRS